MCVCQTDVRSLLFCMPEFLLFFSFLLLLVNIATSEKNRAHWFEFDAAKFRIYIFIECVPNRIRFCQWIEIGRLIDPAIHSFWIIEILLITHCATIKRFEHICRESSLCRCSEEFIFLIFSAQIRQFLFPSWQSEPTIYFESAIQETMLRSFPFLSSAFYIRWQQTSICENNNNQIFAPKKYVPSLFSLFFFHCLALI